jgi:hypothetical protein
MFTAAGFTEEVVHIAKDLMVGADQLGLILPHLVQRQARLHALHVHVANTG